MFSKTTDRLIFAYDAEKLWLEPWGPNALQPSINIEEHEASITNGKIQATVSSGGKLIVRDSKGFILLEEYSRNFSDTRDPKSSSLNVDAREFKPILGGDYHLTARFESQDPKEKLFGMGQYQQPMLDLKGTQLELAHRNSQASVPFTVSSRGYGFLWNNPSIGKAVLGKNIMSFEAQSTKALDYWVVAGDRPADIVEAYANVTGKVPLMPEFGLGFWQCKLRYQTQEELLGVAREYRRRNISIDLIVIDFFHWPKQGDWRFDTTYWPDPDAMIQELKDLKIELMVSIWPTVDRLSENYSEMLERGFLIRTDRGIRNAMNFQGETIHFDATHPGAREYVWNKAKQNYYDKGIKVFWLDEAEPEYTVYDFDTYRYHLGPNIAIGNLYPREYARAWYEGMVREGQTDVVNLLRCAWAGSQRYGALVWSGDVKSTWVAFREQIAAGLNMGLAGIPWWTTDIGGFHHGDGRDASFRELLVRWFQWGAFCPVMRLHGDRVPWQPQHGTTGGAGCCSGAPNEVWSYGPEVEGICLKYINIREEIRGYTRGLMREAHEKGSPVMRTLFYEFPEDPTAWEIETQYMYGDKYLVCPVLELGQRKMSVYLPALPAGVSWKEHATGEVYGSGTFVEIECPLETMPVFVRQ